MLQVGARIEPGRGAGVAHAQRLGQALLGAFLLGLAVFLPGCSPARTFEAMDVLGDIAAGPAPSHLKRITSDPSRRPVAYEVMTRLRLADLYEPTQSPDAALVLVPGLAPAGKDDPRLVAFARTLARARFRVLVPDIPSMRDQKVRPADIVEIADAIAYLATDLASSSGGRASPTVGVVAISYAVGPAILATLRDEAHGDVAFIVAIGGYYDIEAAVTFFTTGYFRDVETGEWRQGVPNEYGKWVFARSNADRVVPARDRDLLRRIADRKMEDPKAEVEDLAAMLGAEGRAIYALLVNRCRSAVPGLIAALPPAIREDMAALDLSHHDLSRLPPRLILVHGRDDAIIPPSESEQLARAAGARAELYLVDSLSHVDLRLSSLPDVLTLLGAVYELLAARDAIAELAHDRPAPPAAAAPPNLRHRPFRP